MLLDSLNGSKKPRVPIEKLSTGGTGPIRNNEDAWRIVPSPPSVIMRSTEDSEISMSIKCRGLTNRLHPAVSKREVVTAALPLAHRRALSGGISLAYV